MLLGRRPKVAAPKSIRPVHVGLALWSMGRMALSSLHRGAHRDAMSTAGKGEFAMRKQLLFDEYLASQATNSKL